MYDNSFLHAADRFWGRVGTEKHGDNGFCRPDREHYSAVLAFYSAPSTVEHRWFGREREIERGGVGCESVNRVLEFCLKTEFSPFHTISLTLSVMSMH